MRNIEFDKGTFGAVTQLWDIYEATFEVKRFQVQTSTGTPKRSWFMVRLIAL